MKYLPKWLFIRFSRLWSTKRGLPFSFQEAIKILNENDKIVANVLSRLVRNGWIETEPTRTDKRKSTYKLINPEIIMKELLKEYVK